MVGAWVRLVANAAMVAMVAVAAQLGAGDALGIIRWDGQPDARAWSTLLTWIAFGYAAAVLAGALAGRAAMRRLAQAAAPPTGQIQGADGTGVRVTATLVAAGTAAATIGLAWLPAQYLQPPVNVDPGLVVALTAGAGVVVGGLLAALALAARPVAAGLQATVAWLWFVATACAVAGLASGEPYRAPRVGVLDVPTLLPTSPWTTGRTMIIAAATIGLAVAAVARWRGAPRLAATLAGFAGPAVVAAAYLIAGPGVDAGLDVQQDPYRSSLLAVAAGLAASALAAIPPGRRQPTAPPAIAPAPTAPADTAAAQAPAVARVPVARTAETGPPAGAVLESVRTPTTPPPSAGPPRPAWATGSGPYARAYTSAAAARPIGDRAPAAAVASWAAGPDTAALAAAVPTGRHALGSSPGRRSLDTPSGQGSGRHAAPE